MNRRRDQPKPSICPIIAVILMVTIGAAGGILYAYYKNRQIQVTREIDETSRNIEHLRLDIRTTEMRSDQLLNRYLIRKRLEEQRSQLRPISAAVVEEINLKPNNPDRVASASP